MSGPCSMPRVLTFNIRTSTKSEKNPADNWSGERRFAVVKFLLQTNADIIGLQEVTKGQLSFLAEQLSPKYSYVAPKSYHGGSKPMIFFKKDIFKAERTKTFWLSQTPEKAGSKFPGAHLPRIVTCALLRQPDGSGLCTFCAHLDHKGMSGKYPIQREQSKILVHCVEEFCTSGSSGDQMLPRVIVGDFNSVKKFGAPPVLSAAGYSDCSQGKDNIPTFVGFGKPTKEATSLHGSHIDWMFVRGVTWSGYSTYDGKYTHSVGGIRNVSDHIAVGAELHLGKCAKVKASIGHEVIKLGKVAAMEAKEAADAEKKAAAAAKTAAAKADAAKAAAAKADAAAKEAATKKAAAKKDAAQKADAAKAAAAKADAAAKKAAAEKTAAAKKAAAQKADAAKAAAAKAKDAAAAEKKAATAAKTAANKASAAKAAAAKLAAAANKAAKAAAAKAAVAKAAAAKV